VRFIPVPDAPGPARARGWRLSIQEETMRELDVPARTRLVRSFGAAVIIALILGAAIGFATLRGGDQGNDGARSAATVSSAGRGEATATAAAGGGAPTATVKAQVRETRIDPFDASHAAVAGLDATLRERIQKAARAAADEGVDEFWLTSGWRTSEYQQGLLNAGVKKHGSLDAALRWVKTPTTSEHVKGAAADVGPTAAAYWMDRNAERFGLCRTYANEIWHYEVRPADGCPPQKGDAAG
jgi:zinc D-Ala-D-Ala carboxypeptidase